MYEYVYGLINHQLSHNTIQCPLFKADYVVSHEKKEKEE